MIVRITNQWGTILQQDRFPDATNAIVNVDPRTFRKLFDGQTTSITVLLNSLLLRVEVLPDEESTQGARIQDCPWCANTDVDMDTHLRVCPERLGPQETARLRLVHGS